MPDRVFPGGEGHRYQGGPIDPFLLLSDMFPALTVVPIAPVVELRPCIVFPPARPLSIVAQDFVATVKETVKDLVPTSPLLRF